MECRKFPVAQRRWGLSQGKELLLRGALAAVGDRTRRAANTPVAHTAAQQPFRRLPWPTEGSCRSPDVPSRTAAGNASACAWTIRPSTRRSSPIWSQMRTAPTRSSGPGRLDGEKRPGGGREAAALALPAVKNDPRLMARPHLADQARPAGYRRAACLLAQSSFCIRPSPRGDHYRR